MISLEDAKKLGKDMSLPQAPSGNWWCRWAIQPAGGNVMSTFAVQLTVKGRRVWRNTSGSRTNREAKRGYNRKIRRMRITEDFPNMMRRRYNGSSDMY